jgi:N-acetylneuraminic acid mutarotase
MTSELRIITTIVALAATACVHEESGPGDPLSGGKGDQDGSCPEAKPGWRAMATYVPEPGTVPEFARYTADGVWSGREAFFLGTTRYRCGSTFCWRNEAAAYDPATDTWRTLASPYPDSERRGLFSRWTGDTWIVFGSHFDRMTGNSTMDGRRYDPGTDTWTDIPAIPVPYLQEGAVEWSPVTNELIVFGGLRLKDGATTPTDDDSYEVTVETWAWTLATNTWRQVADSPLTPREASHAAWDGYRIIFTWGRTYPGFPEEIASIPGAAAYDPVTEEWTKLEEPPVQDRMAFAETTIGSSRAGFWGGHPALGDGDFWLTLHDGAVWDGKAEEWQTITDPGLPGTYRDSFTTWSANGELYVSGGASLEDNGDFNHFVDGAAWSSETATWRPLPAAPVSRQAAVAVFTGCDSIVYGGQTFRFELDNSGEILRESDEAGE